MKAKQKTQKQERIERFESNRQLVETELGFTTLEYNEIQYEIGIFFLEQNFPLGSKYEVYHILYERCPMFWKWWKFEWSNWEAALLNELQAKGLQLKGPMRYVEFMNKLSTESTALDGFQHHYLKKLQYAEIPEKTAQRFA